MTSFKVGMRVRVERDETRWPSKGSWPRYRGREGTVVSVNRDDGEIGVSFGVVRRRPDGSLLPGHNAESWFLPHELTSPAGVNPADSSASEPEDGSEEPETVSCAVCAYADEHGSWVAAIPGLTHCRRCHGTWPRATELQHCTACCRTFTKPGAANLHRRHGTCHDPATILDGKGRTRLAVSSRQWREGTTVIVWAYADHRSEDPEARK